jgi:type I restriction-modification system DNA methylase subunit
MVNEVFSEQLVEIEMNIRKGENSFGFVFPQGDIQGIEKIGKLLKKAGGKPDFCDLSDFSKGGNGKAKPEFIITFNNDSNTIIVVECKKSTKQHESEQHNRPKKFAVDGVLYYAKFLKSEYNVIAIAVSGTKKDDCKVSTYHWQKGFENSTLLVKATGILLEPLNYLELIKGERVQKKYSIEEIRETALKMHDALREIKMTERSKPIFIAGILIALLDEDFVVEYANSASFNSILSKLITAIENVLKEKKVKTEIITNIIQIFKNIGSNPKFKEIPITNTNSILWYIEQLDMKIRPMMNHADVTLDALGVFYHEFVKYSGGDGKGLGIVLTPQHLTEFMVEVSGAHKNSKVVDICAGSGSFLVAAMSKMFKDANDEEIKNIRQNGLYGVELDTELYTLCVTNMIVRKDGKSNILQNDCFNPDIKNALKEKHLTIGLINPPYSQKDHEELQFVECLLDVLSPQGTAVVVVPMSCALGTKFQETRERLFKKHTLKAVFSMPDDIFYSNSASTVVCVMVWEAHKPHDTTLETFFGYYKEDGFVKRKKLGRIDALNKWENIKAEWLQLYRNRDIKEGLSARQCVTHKDEWCVEAYMETDYSPICDNDFTKKMREYIAFRLLNNTDLSIIFELTPFSDKKISLNTEKWKWFELKSIFEMERGVRLTKADREKGIVPLITAGFLNEGVAEYISNEDMKHYRDTITIDMFNNCFYRGYDFCCDDNILVLSDKKLNKYSGLFIATILDLDHYKYQYGRQYRQKNFKKHKIKLPATQDGNPDWQFMENYIKSLPYSKSI